MPAWSVPGSQRTLYPDMRFQRERMSWRTELRACPIWRDPVTFGGGITREYGMPWIAKPGLKYSFLTQNSYHFSSTPCGLKPLSKILP